MILQEPVAYIPGYISCARTSPGGICGSSVFYDILLQQFERIYDSPGRKRLDRWLRREMVERMVALGGGDWGGAGWLRERWLLARKKILKLCTLGYWDFLGPRFIIKQFAPETNTVRSLSCTESVLLFILSGFLFSDNTFRNNKCRTKHIIYFLNTLSIPMQEMFEKRLHIYLHYILHS